MEQTALELIYVIGCAEKGALADLTKVTDIGGLVRLAKKHSLIPYVYNALVKAGYAETESLKKVIDHGRARETLQLHYKEVVSRALCENSIPHVFLKGQDIKKFMPSDVERFSCDVDVYYPISFRKKVNKVMAGLGFKKEEKEKLHDTFFIPPFVSFEMHFVSDLSKKDLYGDFSKFQKVEEYRYQMRDEDIYIYSIIHAVRHFRSAGIGLRALIDCYFIKKGLKGDFNYINEVLNSIGLLEFEKHFITLAELCFNGKKVSGLYLDMLNYIVKSATYGSDYNKNLVNTSGEVTEQKAKRKQFRKRLFPPFREMKIAYPVLKPLPMLLPFLWVYRLIVAVLFKRKKVKGEIKAIKSFSQEKIASNKKMFSELKLD